MSPPQEIIISACSSASSSSTGTASASASAVKTSTAASSSILTHDLVTASLLHSYKTCVAGPACTAYVPTQRGMGGSVWAVQEGKALMHVWAWQKDQMHMKIHLPEKLSCFSVSPNGCWAVGGSPTGQIYLWEIATGLLLASFTAHYRAITTLTFSSDSHLLLSSSLDSAVHIHLVSRLVDADSEQDPSGASSVVGKPYGVLSDHTLAVRDVQLGKTAGSHGGRCWTASDDGTVKIWSLHPPFELLTTFSLPSPPTCLAVDPSERFLYAGTASGDVHLIPLFRHRAALGAAQAQAQAAASALEHDTETYAVGGGGQGSASIRADPSIISHSSPITSLALSLSSTHLLIGTAAGLIHMHALPSHQLLRTLTPHAGPGAGAITHLSTLLRPADFVGGAGVSSASAPSIGMGGGMGGGGAGSRTDEWPVMEIKPFERMRASAQAREGREVPMVMILGGRGGDRWLDELRPRPANMGSGVDLGLGLGQGLGQGGAGGAGGAGGGGGQADTASQIAALESETKRLRASLERAVRVNDQMWRGVVQMKLAPEDGARTNTSTQ